MIIWCLLSLLASIFLWNYFTRDERMVKLGKQFKGPLSFPLIGNLYLYLNKKPEDSLPFTVSLFKKYGDSFSIWAGRRLIIITTDPKYLEVMLSNQRNLSKNTMYEFLTDWLGSGLLLSTGKQWFARRKIITPTFHFKILQQFVEVFIV